MTTQFILSLIGLGIAGGGLGLGALYALYRLLHITFNSKNSSDKTISLNKMIKDELILLKDKNGLCFPLTLSNNREITIAPHSSLVSEVDVALPEGISIKEFVTPNQKLSLGH